jgi:N-acetylmuramoyl-L-alanine amidase
MQRARDQEADLFVSIHADAYHDASARGATVYALSTKRASDEVARRLAERENASDLLGGVSLADKDDVLARVLLDLSQSAAISASMAAGDRVIGRMGDVTRLRKTQVQQGPFLVLTSPDIPSILIETAYISNPKEEQALNSSQYQTDLARAVHAGIVDYFRDNPPPGSYVAMNPPPRPAAPTQHVISSGETLSQIAERYHINLSSLRRTNELRNDRIRIGQVLTIPPG